MNSSNKYHGHKHHTCYKKSGKSIMKKILLPTDFGDLGDYAYQLALTIANKADAIIDVLSVVNGPRGAMYQPDGQLIVDEGNDYKSWEQKLEVNKQKMGSWTRNKSHIGETTCMIGDVNDCILSFAEEQDSDLIIMGTEGLFDQSIWSKPSHAEFVINHSPLPVLTLKCDRSNIDLRKIILAGDFISFEKVELGVLKSLQSLFQSEIMLLKVMKPEARRTPEQILCDMDSFAAANDLHTYSKHIYKDKNIEAGIAKFAEENNVDLIALGTHQRNGFSKLFRHSISDDVVNHLFHPVLTFPIS